MRAVQLSTPGPPDHLRYVELPKPVVGPDEVLVKTAAIGVGMPDMMVRKGIYMWMPKLPAIPGIELSGKIERIGAEVDGFNVGDHVIVSARERPERSGCYAEFIAARTNEIFLLPRSIELNEAACLANYQVAYHLIHRAARAQNGDVALVYAAAGGVGGALLDLSKTFGMRAIAVVSSSRKRDFIQAAPPFAIIDRSAENVAERLLDLTRGRGTDIVFDPVGGPNFPALVSLLAPFGTLVSYGGMDGSPAGNLLESMNKHFGRSPAVRRFSMHALDDRPGDRSAATRELISLLHAGRIKPRIAQVMPLSEAAEAHRLLERGDVMGKIVLSP